jgi:ubiquitin-conjugating enzyme E2 D/E
MSIHKKKILNDFNNTNLQIKNNNNKINIELLNEDITKWQIVFNGPDKTPYENGIFKLLFSFPETYPFKPPVVKFLNKVYHPNISNKGEICLDILSDQWTPTIFMYDIIQYIISLLENPNSKDPLNPSVSRVYKTNIEEFKETAKEWTLLYAK